MLRWIGGILVLTVVAVVGIVRTQPRPSREWKEFSIGPASGGSLWINRGIIRGDGAPLITLLAWVHRIPHTRVIGPPSLQTRYSVVASVADDDPETLSALLKRELETRFHLETHVETRPFDVWVLTGGPRAALAPSKASDSTTSVYERNAKLAGAPMANLAAALQSILGKPVVDETGIRGYYDLEFAWGEEREKSTIAVMRDKFGLVMTPGRRDLEALIVDEVRPDVAMSFFSGVGRLTLRAPAVVRRGISRALTIR